MALFEKNPEWLNAKVIIGHPNFIDNIVKFKWKTVSSKTIADMQKYFKNPNFQPDLVRKDSIGASKVCEWLCAVVEFHNIHNDIEIARE